MTWQPKRLDQLGTVSRGRSRHRPRDAAHLYDGPHPFIQTGDVKHAGLYITDYTQTYSDAGLEQSKLWPAGTLCITIAANIADTAILGIDACFPDSVIGFKADPHQADARFVKYLFDATIKSRAQQFSQGATQDNLSQEKLLSLEFEVPKVDEQTRIADILAAYDGLIENNRRRMALLEESARLLYREWFVRLRFPGHEHCRIVDGVPEGWERKTVNELSRFLKRGITPTYDGEAEGLVINQKCIRDGRVNLGLARHQSKEVKLERRVQHGDVLVNSTGEGTLGRVAQVKTPLPHCTVDTHVTIVRPKESVAPHYFGLAVMEWEPRFSTMGKGATNQTELSPATIGNTEIVMPSHTLLEQFELFAEPLYEQVTNLVAQNQKLRAARDLLLPRLMSGELAV
ncbi:MAG: restriction endonuclease subunit S [Betaproteobacteria bacterium]|nr:restriction endonuclease subunit S [Betaproteobacteria bacterium]